MAAAIIFVMDHARAPRHRADRRVDAEFILVEIQIVDVVEDEPQIAGANIDVADIGLHAAEEIGFHPAASGLLVKSGNPDADIAAECPLARALGRHPALDPRSPEVRYVGKECGRYLN